MQSSLPGKRLDALKQLYYAVRDIGPAAAEAVPALVEVLKDQDANERANAAFVLRWIGPAAAEAVPALVEALKDQADDYVSEQAAETLSLIGQPLCQRSSRP